ILLVVAIAFILIAQSDAKKLRKKPVEDDAPTTLVDRGSFLQVVKGRRAIGPVFLWAGNRWWKKERQGARTTFNRASKVTVWRESAWHALCVGPADILWSIDKGGEVIFTGPITRVSHPSGSTVDLGEEYGSFRIFWGEVDQPLNTFLGDAAHIGVQSRWPGTCYIEWTEFKLGGSPTWPQINYVVEVRPMNIDGPFLSGDAYMPATFAGIGSTRTITALNDAGNPGDDYFRVEGNRVSEFAPGSTLQLVGNGGIPDQAFTVGVATFDMGIPIIKGDEFTLVYPVEAIPAAATVSGTIEGGVSQMDDGWNGAHMLAELLFEKWPHGAGLSVNDWDLGTLQTVADTIGESGEYLRCSMVSPNAPSLRKKVSSIMQDLGLFLPNNLLTGKTEFNLVRKPVGTLDHIHEEMQTKLPELKLPMGPKPINHVTFTFPDQTNNYKDMTISVSDDGDILIDNVFKAENGQIVTTTYYDTAAQMTERRSFEALSRGGEFTLWANRGARLILPGIAMTVEGFSDILRVMAVEPDPQSGKVQLTFINDFYGAKLSDFITGKGNTGTGLPDVLEDLGWMLWEMPEILARGFQQAAIVLHIRATESTQSHYIYASEDGLTYNGVTHDDFSTWTGGQLNDAMGWELEQDQGPEFTFLGPDISLAKDLSSETTRWRRGDQIILFADINGDVEVGFVKKITFISGSTYRLDGLIRARMDSTPLDLPAGTKFFLGEPDEGLAISESWMGSDTPFFAK
ncbi:hypothetical protein LCGC14_2001120, partial [marine sediment metagenome]